MKRFSNQCDVCGVKYYGLLPNLWLVKHKEEKHK